RALAGAFGSMDAIVAAPADALAAVEGIGQVIAESVAEFLTRDTNQVVLDKLRAAGVELTEPTAAGGPAGAEAGEMPQTLAGKSVVVTGTVEGYTREEAEAAILARGGKSPGSVSARTFAVVVGTEPGAAKRKKAEEVGVPVVEGSRFSELLDTGEVPGG
ncbi:MAG: NAD-dependent DNA ligase LigA, partial [Acidobacteriota bacterium]|nr:NAD-dependent DNA ligase LigA [Acidobacteriota bacterium]